MSLKTLSGEGATPNIMVLGCKTLLTSSSIKSTDRQINNHKPKCSQIKCISSINISVLPEIRHTDFAPDKTDWRACLNMITSASLCAAAIYFLSIITSFLTCFSFTAESGKNDKGFPLSNILCNILSQCDQCVFICLGYLNKLQFLLEVMMS